MSAGQFEISRYSTTGLGVQIMPIRVQPETLAATIGGTSNDPPAGNTTLDLRVNVSAGNNAYGVKPRKATLRFTNQAALPAGYSGDDITIPVMTQATFDAWTLGSTGTYLGSDVQVLSKLPERIR